MRVGKYKVHKTGSESYRSYIPVKLPIQIQAGSRLMEKTSAVLSELGHLSVPSLDLFLYIYVRKEAVLSSQIEGTQSSLNDLHASLKGLTPSLYIQNYSEAIPSHFM